MSIGAQAFASIYASLPDLHAQLRIDGRTVVSQCVVASVGGERIATDEGIAISPDVSLRTLTASIPDGKAMQGDTVEVSTDEGATWKWYKIGNRVETAGMSRLVMEDVTHAR